MATKIDMKTIAILGLIAVIVLAGTGYITLNDTGLSINDQDTPTVLPDGTVAPAVPESSIRAATAQYQIKDALTKTANAAGATAYVGILVADSNGVFNPLNPTDEEEFASAPDYTQSTYSVGEDLIIAVSSDLDPTGGNETYPRWFYIKDLDHNVPIYAFPIRNPISAINQVKIGTTYKFTVNENVLVDTGYRVAWLAGNTNYWDFKTFEVYGRVAKQNMIVQITNKGVVGTTFNDGATWEDTDTETNANFTFTGDTEDLYFELVGEVNNVAFGLPTLAVSASGQVIQYNGVLVWTTDALGVDPIELTNDGWVPISKPDLTADVAYYYVIDAEQDGGIPNTGSSINKPYLLSKKFSSILFYL